MTILVPLIPVDRVAGVETRIELVAVGTRKEAVHKIVNLRRVLDMIAVEVRFEVVKPVGIGLLLLDGGSVVVGVGCLDRIGVV